MGDLQRPFIHAERGLGLGGLVLPQQWKIWAWELARRVGPWGL